jgi:putative methyltransferase (TIGR04325 family)
MISILKKIYRKLGNLIDSKSNIPTKTQIRHIISWSGNYASWEEAKQLCTGYEADAILKKVRASVLKVKNGEAVYERDSVTFDKMQYSWPLLSCLFKIGVEHGNRLSVVDFGGSLGSSYFQNRDFLKGLQLEWSVVEQEHFVKCGQQEIADEQLKFYYTIEDCLKERQPNVLLLSGVLQCLDRPYEWIEDFLKFNFNYIIIDRTAFVKNSQDILTIQEVHEPIYEASYPAWFFNTDTFIKQFENYKVICDFDSGFTPPMHLENGFNVYWSGLLMELCKN